MKLGNVFGCFGCVLCYKLLFWYVLIFFIFTIVYIFPSHPPGNGFTKNSRMANISNVMPLLWPCADNVLSMCWRCVGHMLASVCLWFGNDWQVDGRGNVKCCVMEASISPTSFVKLLLNYTKY